MSAGELLREVRTRHGLSQRALAQASGVAQPVIARIEAGRQQPSESVLSRILAGAGERLVLSTEPLPDPHDLGLLEVTLALTPTERIRRLTALHRTAERLRTAQRR